MTLTDEQFLLGRQDGKPATIAGVLRIPRIGAQRSPAVLLVHGSGGLRGNIDYWQQQLNAMEIATFAIDVFSGRGITSTIEDQSQLGRLAPIVDVYRALGVLASHPAVDPGRIVLLGFSRGAQAVLYSSLGRFRSSYARNQLGPIGYITFYTPCYTKYIDDEEVDDKPIRLFHGLADDYVPVASCEAYIERLRRAGKDVQLTRYADAHHSFDNPLLPKSVFLPDGQSTRNCRMVEESPGRIVNAETKEPFTMNDPCVELGVHTGYNPAAAAAATQAVKDFLLSTFALN